MRLITAAGIEPVEAPEFGAQVPVAIIGGGACGLIAALTLKDAGTECVVLERDAVPQGSTALSSGFIPACGTRWQRDIGVADSADALAADIERKNHNGARLEVVRAAAAASGPALEWLADAHGIPFQVLEGFLYPGHGVARMHAVPEKTGAGLIGRLTAAAQGAGVDILTGAPVSGLYADDTQRVVGLRITRADGSLEHIACDALILACNGYGGNRAMLRQYIPEIADAEYAGHAGNQGDAVLWGHHLGAAIADMGAYQGHGSWATPHGQLVTWALMTEGGIQVNAQGLRFWNEHQGYSEASQHVIAQPGRFAWNVYDQRLHDFAMSFPDYVQLCKAGAIREAYSASALASQLQLPVRTLEETLYNTEAMQRGDLSDPHGREFIGKPALQAPYYAVKVTGALFHTQGGLEIDADARVLRADGSALPNLYAGGGAARGISGAAVWGYLSGNGLLTAVTQGRLAALHVAATLRS
ncbi:MAG TPA: FAD-dependent oxidoreductase [Burkholderiales bacterium]|jgi:fumarate reductase flavoprotein subunit|nr:FAD-dependent oxidoreductase [Burkholderiales bacterium]